MNVKIGAEIKKVRLKNSLTQEELAELAELSLSCISRLETGKTMVSVEKLYRISKILNTTIDSLIEEVDNSTSSPKYLKEICKIAEVLPENLRYLALEELKLLLSSYKNDIIK